MDTRIRRTAMPLLPPKPDFYPVSQSIGHGLLIALTIASFLGSSFILLVLSLFILYLTLGIPLSSFNNIFSNPITIASEASLLIFIGCACAILHIGNIEHSQE